MMRGHVGADTLTALFLFGPNEAIKRPPSGYPLEIKTCPPGHRDTGNGGNDGG